MMEGILYLISRFSAGVDIDDACKFVVAGFI